MAVTQVIPCAAITPPEGELDERGNRRYRWTYIAITDDVNDGIVTVGNAPGIPIQYSAYMVGNDVDLGATLKSIRPVRRQDTLTVWDVHLEWDSALQSADQGEQNPVARRRKKGWSTTGYELPVVTDLYGNPILNAAKDEFDPPAMRTAHGLRLVYQKNLASEQEVSFAFSYLNSVNDDVFQGFVPGTCCCVDVDADEDFDNGIFFWPTTLTFEFRRIIINPVGHIHEVNSAGVINQTRSNVLYPWNLTLANMGLSEMVGGQKKRIIGSDGKPVPQPVRLNADGTKTSFDRPRSETTYLTWTIFEEKAFAPLGII